MKSLPFAIATPVGGSLPPEISGRSSRLHPAQRWAAVLVIVLLLFQPSDLWGQDSATYSIGPGDKLKITVFGEEDLSKEVTIGPDYTLALPLIGQLSVANLSLAEIEAKITSLLLDGYLIDPSVTVEILESRPVYILGDVQAPGSYAYRDGMTVLNVIALAGGQNASKGDQARAQIALTQAEERLELLLKSYRATRAQEARLITQRDDLDAVAFPDDLEQQRSDPEVSKILEGEERIFKAQQTAVNSQIKILEAQIPQIKAELGAIKAQQASEARQLKLVNSEIEGVEVLLKKGYARKTRLVQLKRQASEIEGRQSNLQASIAQTNQKVGGTQLAIINLKNDRLKEIVDTLQSVQKQISDIETSLQTAKEQFRQTEIAASRIGSSSAFGLENYIWITRNTRKGPEETEATNTTSLLPGDIVRIYKRSPDQTPSALAPAPQPGTD